MNKKTEFLKKLPIVKIVLFTIVFTIFFSMVAIGYSIVRSDMEVQGTLTIRENTDSCVGSVVVTPANSWTSGGRHFYQFNIDLTNTSDKEYDFWDISFDYPVGVTLDQVSNARSRIEGSKLVLANESYNARLLIGATVRIWVQISTNFAGYTIPPISINNCQIKVGPTPTPAPTNIRVTMNRTDYYGSFNSSYTLTVTNIGTTTINAWSFVVELPAGVRYDSSWSCNFVVRGNQIEISNLSWNGTLAPGASVSGIGLVLHSTLPGPINYRIIGG